MDEQVGDVQTAVRDREDGGCTRGGVYTRGVYPGVYP